MIDVKEPKKIYDNLNKSILVIIDKLQLKTDDEKLEASKFEVVNLIDAFRKERLDVAIDNLKTSQEWEKFTIAFFGETNAGKSTIIEALRIYFQEEEKLIQQEMFKKIVNEYGAYKITLETQIDSINKYIWEKNTYREQFTLEFKDNKNDLEEKINQITFDDLKKKENSIIYKILSLLCIINIHKDIDKINSEIKNIKTNYEEEVKNLDDILLAKNEELMQLENEIKSLEISTLNKLQSFVDGQIIGDGRSDFTKKSTSYNFSYNDQEFAFLDVPGIEGNETIVIDEISNAVKKAHAVFYVTSSSTPPQKGDEHKKGTLEKIKEHLSSQTEVYTIFNKRITNPIQLSKALVSDDEKESLKIVDQKITEILGENYVGNRIVSGRIAFLAIAECMLVESPAYNEKKKFLDKFSVKELIDKANFNELCSFITKDLVVNTRQKIKKSNYNKASELLNELIQILDKALKDNFEPLYKQIEQEVCDASSNLQNTLSKIKIELNSVIDKSLRDFENNTRKDIYDHIKNNVSDSSLKNKLEELLQEHSQTMSESIPKEIEKRIIKFQESTTEVLMNFKRRVDLLIQDYQTFDFGNFDSKFKVDLQMDNGIDKMALTGSLIGAGGLAYSAVMFSNSWNPLGWTMFAIGVVSVLIGGYKSFRKFLSDDYKKSEQRKSAEQNIENIIDEVKPKMMENIKTLSDEFSELVDRIINDLDTIVLQREVVNEHVKTVHKELVQIAKLIKIEGES